MLKFSLRLAFTTTQVTMITYFMQTPPYVFIPRSPKSRLKFCSTLCYKVNIPLGLKREDYMNKGVARGECLMGGGGGEH